jgi:hypothetical protein
MRKNQVIIFILISLVFSGCIENITSGFQRVQVVYVNLSVVSQDNRTIIQYIHARGGEVSKLNAPGAVLPDKFPSIYAEILQQYNASKSATLQTISLTNGQEYTGPGNYSFTIHLLENTLNKSQPIFVYAEIDTDKTIISRTEVKLNWTE